MPQSDQFDLHVAESNLRRINANLQSTFINLNVTDYEYAEIQTRLRGDEADSDEPREPLEFSNRTLRRIFALGGYENGGRFYGGWWQGVPSEYRQFIEIDGAVTREMDFSSMQPRLMYAEVSHKPPKDAYTLPGWPDKVRPYAKKAFNQLVNSDPSSQNENQWHRFAPETDPRDPPKGWDDWSEPQKGKERRKEFERVYGRPYSDLLRDLLEMHKPIGRYFFSSAWGRGGPIRSDSLAALLS